MCGPFCLLLGLGQNVETAWMKASLFLRFSTFGDHPIVTHYSFHILHQLIQVAIGRHNNVLNILHKQLAFKCKLVKGLRVNPRIFWQISPESCVGTEAMVTTQVVLATGWTVCL